MATTPLPRPSCTPCDKDSGSNSNSSSNNDDDTFTTTHVLFQPPRCLPSDTPTIAVNNNNNNTIRGSDHDRRLVPALQERMPKPCFRTNASFPRPVQGLPVNSPSAINPIVTSTVAAAAINNRDSNSTINAYGCPEIIRQQDIGRLDRSRVPGLTLNAITSSSSRRRTDSSHPRAAAAMGTRRKGRGDRDAQHEKLREQLKKMNKKLGKRVKTLGALLVTLVLLAVITALPLTLLFPSLRMLLPWEEGRAAALEDDAESDCVNVRGHFQADSLRNCGLDTQRVCGLNARSSMCLLKEAKQDLDRRTRILDRHLDEQNNILIPKIEDIRNASISVRGISAIYSRRASAFLRLFYSHEENRDQGDRLRWATGVREFETIRGVGFSDDVGYGKVIQIKAAGYYHVYSQVTFKSNSVQQHQIVYKNYGEKNKKYKLLESTGVTTNTSPVSYLQGVFVLRKGDTLSVVSHIDSINLVNKTLTFFGAFEI